MKAVYYYHPTKDYVEKSENFYDVDSGINDFPTKQWVSYFNEQGDIIKREFILNKFKNATIIPLHDIMSMNMTNIITG